MLKKSKILKFFVAWNYKILNYYKKKKDSKIFITKMLNKMKFKIQKNVRYFKIQNYKKK